MTYCPRTDSAASYDAAIDAMRERHDAIMAAGAKRIEYIGDAVLIEGDCLDILPALGRVDAVVTDPPYGVLAETGSAATRRSGGNADKGICAWDVVPERAVYDAILATCEDAMIWGGCHMPLPPTFGYLVWDKDCVGLNFGEVEYCWSTRRFAPRLFRNRAAGMDGGKLHPTQKPIELMRWCLGFVPDAKSILDPFMGSGTTGVAALQLGRRFIGIELDPGYFDIACKRVREAWKQPRLFDEPKPAKPVNGNLFDGDAA